VTPHTFLLENRRDYGVIVYDEFLDEAICQPSIMRKSSGNSSRTVGSSEELTEQVAFGALEVLVDC